MLRSWLVSAVLLLSGCAVQSLYVGFDQLAAQDGSAPSLETDDTTKNSRQIVSDAVVRHRNQLVARASSAYDRPVAIQSSSGDTIVLELHDLALLGEWYPRSPFSVTFVGLSASSIEEVSVQLHPVSVNFVRRYGPYICPGADFNGEIGHQVASMLEIDCDLSNIQLSKIQLSEIDSQNAQRQVIPHPERALQSLQNLFLASGDLILRDIGLSEVEQIENLEFLRHTHSAMKWEDDDRLHCIYKFDDYRDRSGLRVINDHKEEAADQLLDCLYEFRRVKAS